MRLVSLLASATEIIYALGCLDQLVGRSHECDYPPEIGALPTVSTVQIDIETSSAQIDAQIKQLVQSQFSQEDAALKALSIYNVSDPTGKPGGLHEMALLRSRANPDADQPSVCSHTGAVQKECASSDPGVAFPAPGSLIVQLNRLMGCPKPVLSKDRRF